jgi:hypothetical protein
VTTSIRANVIQKETPSKPCNRPTNWVQFQTYINGKKYLSIGLNVKQELEEAVEYITKLMQEAATISTRGKNKKSQNRTTYYCMSRN